jgi:hypothetical protein
VPFRQLWSRVLATDWPKFYVQETMPCALQVGVVASPIAILNEFVTEALAEGLHTGADPALLLDVLGRIMAVAQVCVCTR